MKKEEIKIWLKVLLPLLIILPGFPLTVKIFFILARYAFLFIFILHHKYYTTVLTKDLYTIHSTGVAVSTGGYITATVIYTFIAVVLSVPIYKLIYFLKTRKAESKEDKNTEL